MNLRLIDTLEEELPAFSGPYGPLRLALERLDEENAHVLARALVP